MIFAVCGRLGSGSGGGFKSLQAPGRFDGFGDLAGFSRFAGGARAARGEREGYGGDEMAEGATRALGPGVPVHHRLGEIDRMGHSVGEPLGDTDLVLDETLRVDECI